MVKYMAVDKLDFLIFEKDPDLYGRIRDVIINYSVRNDIEADIYWVSKENQMSELTALSKTVHIAFINGDYEQVSLLAGKKIFNEDEDVLVAFYAKDLTNVKDYFASRPIAYIESGKDSFESVIESMHTLMRERKKVFIWTNKNVRLFIPHSRIIYMQSYKGYVDIITSDSGKYHILGKLDAVEERLKDDKFLRVHKSAIVNIGLVRSMDRTNKCFTMSNGDQVYISKANYKTVSDCFANDIK